MLRERKFQKLHEEICCTIEKMLPSNVTAHTFNIWTDGWQEFYSIMLAGQCNK